MLGKDKKHHEALEALSRQQAGLGFEPRIRDFSSFIPDLKTNGLQAGYSTQPRTQREGEREVPF